MLERDSQAYHEVDLPVSANPAAGNGQKEAADNRVRLSRLLVVLALLLAVVLGPYVVYRYQYAATRAKLQAEVDVATEGLPRIKASLNDLVLASRLVVKKVAPSVVSIHRADLRGNEGQGSGVIIDEAGYIVTNYHVVAGATGLHVILADGRMADPVVVGGDVRIDLAVLKIDLPNLIAAEWGDSHELQVGDLVWALGSPFGLDHTVTFGIVSAKERRSTSGVTSSPFREYVQSDVAVNPGNSGGPLVDLEGRVVGINTLIVGPSYQGISFAIPSRLVRNSYERLKTEGWIERGYLGVSPQPVTAQLRRRLRLEDGEGVLVGSVSPHTPAARAGLRQNDVILRWNNHFASDPFLLTQVIADSPVGSQATLLVKRLIGNRPEEFEVEVTVGAAPRLERLGE